MNNQQAWEEFAKTGSVDAYLRYRGINCALPETPGGEHVATNLHRRSDNKDCRYRQQ